MLQTIQTTPNRFIQPPQSATSKEIEEDNSNEWGFLRRRGHLELLSGSYYDRLSKTFYECGTALVKNEQNPSNEVNWSWKDYTLKNITTIRNVQTLAISSYNSLSSLRKQTINRKAKLASYEELYEEEF